MQVNLTPGQEAVVKYAIDSGRLQRAEEAVEEALLLWEERERNRIEILMAVDEAESDLAAGRVTEYIAATLPQLAAELKREARTRS